MSYSYDKFLRTLTESDRNIQIQEDNGVVKWTIEPFSIINAMVSNNLLKINVLNRVILVPFSSQNESKLALEKIQLQIDELRSRTNELVSLEIKNYVDNYVNDYVGTASPNYFKDLGSYLTPIDDNKSLFTSGTYGIGTLTEQTVDPSIEVNSYIMNPTSIRFTNNKFYISGYYDIQILDDQFNLLQSYTSPVEGSKIISVNETANRIYFSSNGYPGTLFYINTLTDELIWRGYGSAKGILWNASYMGSTSGWSDLSDITSRSYTSFPGALNYAPPNCVGEEMVMWDTINNKYYTFMFSFWQSGNAGGGITYDRREILSVGPTVLGATVSFNKPNFGTQSDIIDTNVEITRGNNKALFNPVFETVYKDSSFYSIKYNPVNNKVYTYDFSNNILVVMTDDLVWESDIIPITNVNPWGTAYSVGMNTTNGDIYIVDGYGTILAYDITNTKVVDIDPVISFNNFGYGWRGDLLTFNSSNDTMYISDGVNIVYMIDGTTRTLTGSLDLTTITSDIQYLNSIEYSSGEILISGIDIYNKGIIIKIDDSNVITVLGNTELHRSYQVYAPIINTIKVNDEYAYIMEEGSSYYLSYPSYTVINENKIIGGSASANRTHQLQDADGVIAHLSDMLVQSVELNDGFTISSNELNLTMNTNKIIWVDQQYGNNSTAIKYSFIRKFSSISAAMSVAVSGDLIWIRPGDYNESITLKDGVNIHCDPNVTFGSSSGTFAMGDAGVSVTCRITGKPTLNRRYQNTALSIGGPATNFYGDFNEIRSAGSVFAIGGTENTNVHIKCINVLDSMFNGMFYRTAGEPNIRFECTGYCTAGGAYGAYFPGQRWLFIFLNTVGVPFTGKFDVKINELRIPEQSSFAGDYGNFGTQGPECSGIVNIEIEKIVDNATLNDFPALFYNSSSTKWNIKVNQPFTITRRPLISVYGVLSPEKGELTFSGNATCVNFTPISHTSADQRLIIKDSKISRSSGVSDSNLIINQTTNGGYLKVENSILYKESIGTLTDTVVNLSGASSSINFLNSYIILDGSTASAISGASPTVSVYFNSTRSNMSMGSNIMESSIVNGFLPDDLNLINII